MLEVMHTDQIMQHGGTLGIRDEGLLEAALARPKHNWSYDATVDFATLAAAYGFAVAKNHAFLDGNKRTALIAIYTFWAINGFELETLEPEAVTTIVGIADGSITEEELADWIRDRLIPWVD